MDENCVLFSFIGGTDPVRTEHDGPMLHILRQYRPKAVVCLLSSEMKARAEKDNWPQKLFTWLKEHWDYSPKVILRDLNVKRVNIIDDVSAPIIEEFETVRSLYPKEKILINLTSGTPQMLMVASLLCLDTRYANVVGVQVSTPVRKMNDAQHYTDKKDADLYEELEKNLDEEQLENRCFEPELYALKKEKRNEQLRSLLDSRDFAALEVLKNEFPHPYGTLVHHMFVRNLLKGDEARACAEKIADSLDFNLYPHKNDSSMYPEEMDEYWNIVETYLVLKNLQARQSITELVLKLEPFTVALQKVLIDKLLRKQLPEVGWEDLLDSNSEKPKFDPAKIKQYWPGFYNTHLWLFDKPGKGGKQAPSKFVSFMVCDLMLKNLPGYNRYGKFKTYAKYYGGDRLKEWRNKFAHSLTSMSEIEFRRVVALTSAKFLELVGEVIQEVFPSVCDPELFNVYDKCIDCIKRNI